MMLYHETLETTVARRRDVLIDSKREAVDALSTRFYAGRDNIAILAMRHIGGGRKRKRGGRPIE